MNLAAFILTVTVIYLVTRGLLAMLTRELRARLQDNYRFVGPLVTPLHWVLLLASVLIAMSLIGLGTERFVLLFYLVIAWFVFRAFTIILFEWWFATIKGISLPGVARRLISIVIAFAALLAFLRFRLDVRADDLAIITAVAGVIIALFFQSFLRDLFLGISFALDKPIKVGDWISIDGHEGQVMAVDWKTTTLRNDRNEHMVLPNRRIADGVVVHVARETWRRHQLELSISADAPPPVLLAELASAVAEAPHVLSDPPPKVYYCGEQAGEGRFEASFWSTGHDRRGCCPFRLADCDLVSIAAPWIDRDSTGFRVGAGPNPRGAGQPAISRLRHGGADRQARPRRPNGTLCQRRDSVSAKRSGRRTVSYLFRHIRYFRNERPKSRREDRLGRCRKFRR